MSNDIKVTLPVLSWYGDEELQVDFPESWEVHVFNMKGYNTPSLSNKKILEAFANPIGAKPIRDAARGKKEVAILFDDMARPTPTAKLIPYILKELAIAGIHDDNIRFIAAVGAHGAMNGIDFRKKLGNEVMERFLVYNHNPYENCTPLGRTSLGTPVAINSEFMSCDYKIGIGSILPHPYGFGGGCKIVLPGVSFIDTIDANHSRLRVSPTVGWGKTEGNVILQDINEAARMAGLDFKIDVILNLRREITAVFMGDPIEQHKEGIKLARTHYAMELPASNADIVIANCYGKANEMAMAPSLASHFLSEKGGDMVIIAVTPEGQINHYFLRSFGRDFGGRGWNTPGPTGRHLDLPPKTKRLTIMSPYPDRAGADWIAPYHLINWKKTWAEVINDLKVEYGDTAKVAVISDATMQYIPIVHE